MKINAYWHFLCHLTYSYLSLSLSCKQFNYCDHNFIQMPSDQISFPICCNEYKSLINLVSVLKKTNEINLNNLAKMSKQKKRKKNRWQRNGMKENNCEGKIMVFVVVDFIFLLTLVLVMFHFLHLCRYCQTSNLCYSFTDCQLRNHQKLAAKTFTVLFIRQW